MGHKPRPKMPLRDTYETTAEVMSAIIAVKSVKLTIEYVCSVECLDVPDVLDTLREDGTVNGVQINNHPDGVQLIIAFQCDVDVLDVDDLLNRLRDTGAAEIVEVVGCPGRA